MWLLATMEPTFLSTDYAPGISYTLWISLHDDPYTNPYSQWEPVSFSF